MSVLRLLSVLSRRNHHNISKRSSEYQEIIRKSDIYSDKLEALQLPKETRLLIDRYVSEQNALGSRYGMLAYQIGFSKGVHFSVQGRCIARSL